MFIVITNNYVGEIVGIETTIGPPEPHSLKPWVLYGFRVDGARVQLSRYTSKAELSDTLFRIRNRVRDRKGARLFLDIDVMPEVTCDEISYIE